MRRLLLLLISILLLIFAFSCDADIQIYPQDPVKGVVLRATYVGNQSTKTELDNLTTYHTAAEIRWSSGDSLSLFYNQAEPAGVANDRYVTNQLPESSANFYPDPAKVPEGEPYLGLYPYNEEASAVVEGSSPSIQTVLPASQKAISNNFDPKAMLAVGYSNTLASMSFYNVCSGLCFTLSSDSSDSSELTKYSRIEFKGRNNEKIAGNVNISLKTPSSPKASALAEGASEIITLVPEGGTFHAGVDYYVMLVPGTFNKGFSMTFYGANNQKLYTRSCEVKLSFTLGRFAYITEVDVDGKLAAIRSGVDLASPKPANCYVVSEAGTYRFPMVRGNSTSDELKDVSAVTVLWETDNTADNQTVGSVIKDVTFNKGYVYFDTPSTLKSGNALIAALSGTGDNTKVLWSWHIWVCKDYNPQASAKTLFGKGKKILDRNIGALSAVPNDPLSNGFFYQWGRKDPFAGSAKSYLASGGQFFKLTAARTTVASESVSATEDYAIEHPTTFITASDGNWLRKNVKTLWGTSKTIYDPCPPGWKVPAISDWSDVDYQRTGNAQRGYGLYFRIAGSESDTWFPNSAVWFPNNGYVSTSGSLLMVGQYSCYWSCEVSGNYSSALEQSQTGVGNYLEYIMKPMETKVRVEAYSVRCVEDK